MTDAQEVILILRNLTILHQEEVLSAIERWDQEATNDEEDQRHVNSSILCCFANQFEIMQRVIGFL